MILDWSEAARRRDCLIWSHALGRWLGRDGQTGARQLSAAGRFTRSEAVAIAAEAAPGAILLGALPLLPVRLADLEQMRGRHQRALAGRPLEPWW